MLATAQSCYSLTATSSTELAEWPIQMPDERHYPLPSTDRSCSSQCPVRYRSQVRGRLYAGGGYVGVRRRFGGKVESWVAQMALTTARSPARPKFRLARPSCQLARDLPFDHKGESTWLYNQVADNEQFRIRRGSQPANIGFPDHWGSIRDGRLDVRRFLCSLRA